MRLPSGDKYIGVPVYSVLRDRIREEIITGILATGARITAAEIADRFGVSPVPVREALQWLQGEGLVTVLPHKGARVLSLDVRFVRNVYDLCGIIEGLLTRLSLPNLTNATMNQLQDTQSHLCWALDNGEWDLFRTLNQNFHRLIFQHSCNPEAKEISDRYTSLFATMRQKYGTSPQRVAAIGKEHEEILKALRSQDEEGAEQLARLHSKGAKEDLLKRMSQVSECVCV